MNTTNKTAVEELLEQAVDYNTEDDGSGHRAETTYTFHKEDLEKALTKAHQQGEREERERWENNPMTIEHHKNICKKEVERVLWKIHGDGHISPAYIEALQQPEPLPDNDN